MIPEKYCDVFILLQSREKHPIAIGVYIGD
jgi:hypothetical protein